LKLAASSSRLFASKRLRGLVADSASAMKVARSLFEISITAEYLEKNPAETDLYLDFAHVIAWKHLQDLERKSPGKVPPEHKRESEIQYNRVKAKFEKNGKVRSKS